MDKRRILYRLGSSGRDEWMYKISQFLQKKVEHEPFFQCSKFGYQFIREKVDEKNIVFLDDINKNKIVEPDMNFLSEIEKKYDFNIWDNWEIVAQRRQRERKTPVKKILIDYEHVIRGLEKFLDDNKITDFVIYGTSATTDLILFKMMKQKNINIIQIRPSPLNKKFGILTSLNNRFYDLNENYLKIKQEGLSKEKQEKTFKILQGYQQKTHKLDWAVKYKETKIKKIVRYSRAGMKVIRHKQLPSRYRPLFWGIIQKTYDQLNLFEEPHDEEKFVLYPLHHQPEASTLIYGKWYNNQLNLIENLVKSLPIGYKLYVKEHSHGYGERHLKFFKDIKKYNCVRLISPKVDNSELIKKSSLIVSITGTVGWEAIIFGKPILIFGDTFYDQFDCVKKIKQIENLPIVLRNLLDQKISQEETLMCMASLIDSTYPGLAFLPADCGYLSSTDENVELLAQGISNHINKLNQKEVKNKLNIKHKLNYPDPDASTLSTVEIQNN